MKKESAEASAVASWPGRRQAGLFWLRLAPLAVLLAAFAIRVYRLGIPSIWWDEGYSVDLARRGLLEAAALTASDIHPPLYYWLLHGWIRVAGDSEFAVRFLSVIIGLLLAACLFRLGARLFGFPTGLAALTVAAASPFYIAYSQEARMYILEALLALLAAYFAYLVIRPGTTSRFRDWIAYVGFATAGLYADYFVGLTLITVNIWAGLVFVYRLRQPSTHLERKFGRTILNWSLAQIAVLALYLPWLGVAARQIGTYGQFKRTAPPIGPMIQQLAGAFNAGPAGAAEPSLALAAGFFALVGLGVILAWRQPNAFGRGWLVGQIVICLVVFVIAMQARPFFHVRYLFVATPFYYLLVGLALAQLVRLNRLLVPLEVAAILLVAVPATQAYFFDADLAKDDTRSAAAYLESTSTARDLVLFQSPQPFGYYFDGPALGRYFPVSLGQVTTDLAALSADRQQAYWVTWYQSDQDPWQAVPFLLERYGRVVEERTFPGYDVTRYELTQPIPTASFPASFESTDLDFGPVVLTGIDLPDAVPADRSVTVGLRFQGKDQPPPLKFSIRLVDEQHSTLAIFDHVILSGDDVPPDAIPSDGLGYAFARLQLPVGLRPGEYELEIVLYETAESTDEGGGEIVWSSPTIELGMVRVSRPERQVPIGQEPIGQRIDQSWSDLTLVGVDWAGGQVARIGSKLTLDLLWRAEEELESDQTFNLVLTDKSGNRTVERLSLDRGPAGGLPGDLLRQRVQLPIPATLNPGQFALTLEREGEQVTLGQIEVKDERERRFELPADITPLEASFGDSIELAGYRLDGDKNLAPGDHFILTLYWRAKSPTSTSYTVFTQLLDGELEIRGQHDGVPMDGQAPTTSWRPGEIIEDRRELIVSKDAQPGAYTVILGLYDRETGKRLSGSAGDHVTIEGFSVR